MASRAELRPKPRPGAAMWMPSYGPPAVRALTRAAGAFYAAPPAGGAMGWLDLAAAWRPDGRAVVTVSEDALVRVWELDGDAPPRVLRGHTGGVLRAMWSPDGLRLATASKDKTVRIWSDGAGDPQVLRGHTAEVYTVAWSPDGSQLATASMDGTLRIWSELEPLVRVDDPRLWAASRHCIGVDRRVELLSVPRALAAADDAACRLRVERALAAPSRGPGEG